MNPLELKNRTWAEISHQNLIHNLRVLDQKAQKFSNEFLGSVAMVKCDAYGHGLGEVSKTLSAQNQVMALGVACFDEAVALRQNGVRKPVWVFSDGLPLTESSLQMARELRLTLSIHSIEDLKLLLRQKRQRPDFQIKLNTGFNRLGVDYGELSKIKSLLRQSRVVPQGFFSHLVDSDLDSEKGSAVTLDQVKKFRSAAAELGVYCGSYIHMSNSGGVFSEGRLKLGAFCNVIRPGIALYGYLADAKKQNELKPVLRLKTHVLKTRTLPKGSVVGYGATYRAREKLSQNILSLGYGDGISRTVSNQEILICSQKKPQIKKVELLGRVSMDLLSIKASYVQGDEVTLLGENQKQGHVLAEASGSVIYEILTSLSSRVHRIHK